MVIRSFLAFELPPDIKRTVTLISEDARRSKLNVRWVKVDNIHLTVVFMGNVREDDVPSIKEAIKTVCIESGPFDISLKGVGVFPNARRPRIIWLGLDGEIERIASLRDGLQKQLRAFGIKEEERMFRPHLTLGRFRKPNRGDPRLDDIIARYKDHAGPVCRLEELIMFKSELKPGGAEYSRLGSWRLSKNPGAEDPVLG
jgi:RNA 2',3'-cyclic 3'-phosphodiesterase